MLGAMGCLGDISCSSVKLPRIQLILGLEFYQFRDQLARRTAQSLLPGESFSVFLGGVEGSWRSFLYPECLLNQNGPCSCWDTIFHVGPC